MSASQSRRRHRTITGRPRLHVVEWGPEHGAAVVLLHGATHLALAWEDVAAALDGYRVIAPDARGHGASDRAPTYAAAAYLEDVERVIDRLDAAPVAVIGHSTGSLIAMQYAAAHADDVWAAAFVDIDARPPDAQRERLREAGARPARVYDSRRAARERLVRTLPGAPDETVERFLAAAFVDLPDGRLRQHFDQRTLAEWPAFDNRHLLPAIRCPALVVRGGASTVHSAQAARAMAAALPDARLVEIAGAEHVLHLTHAAPLAATLRGFLDAARRAS